LAKLPAHRQRSMAGYGTIELIGEPTCQTYWVPFVRPRALFQSEQAFWALPGAPGASDMPVPSEVRVPMEIHVADVTIPIVTYTKKLQGDKRVAPKAMPKPKRKARKQNPDSGSSPSPSSSSSEEEEAADEEQKSAAVVPVPVAWGANMQDCKRGAFAMLEVEYKKGGKGISLVEVLFCAFFLALFRFHWISNGNGRISIV
jgi:hypothetical protein